LAAQVFDNTGNGKLNGTYYFREVVFDTSSGSGASLYGNIVFTGSGTYTTTGLGGYNLNSAAPNGTYTISASGYGYIVSPVTGSPIYGLVGANGVFVGSSTEITYNDLFIAAPVSGQSTSTLQGSYSLGYLELDSQIPYDALLTMTANGSGGIGSVSVTAYTNSSAPAKTQTISGVNYRVSNNAFVVAFPNSSSNLVAGNEYLYSTPDGSFVFGGSPNDFDMMVGVKTGTSGSGFGASYYYEAGMDVDESQLSSAGTIGVDSYYGSFDANNGTIVGHRRLQYGSGTAQGYTYTDSYPLGSGGSYNDTFTSTQYIGGSGGAVRVGLGIGPYLGVSVAVQAPAFTPASSVYLYPNGVVNAASYAPFTAGVSRGELVTLLGTGLASGPLQIASSLPLPTKLGNVQVLVNGLAAPIYYVSPTQVSVVVPWEISASIAQFQVVNNGTYSNAVTEFVNLTTPGVFTNPSDGIGYAAAIHQDGVSPVTPSNPAQIGETISVYLTGLGDVFPSIADGTAGPSGVLSNTSNTITADVDGTLATVLYQGLAPGLVALYQVNLTIPAGITSGDHYLDISGPDSYTTEALISIGGAAAASVPSEAPRLQRRPQAFKPIHQSGGRPAIAQ
jgi:uncharacterized protein (TIGR03437 family)